MLLNSRAQMVMSDFKRVSQGQVRGLFALTKTCNLIKYVGFR